MSSAFGRQQGRPKADESPVDAEQILDAALRAFARHGYDAVSVRTLNRELGVSHNLLHQRYGSKAALWKAAMDHAFIPLVSEISGSFDPTIDDPLDQLNHVIRRFLGFAAAHPEILAVMNVEAGLDTARLDYLYDTYIQPALEPLGRLLEHLVSRGRIRPVSLRTLHFLVSSGASAPFTLAALARRFDGPDPLDPAEIAQHAAMAADVITAGLAVSGQN